MNKPLFVLCALLGWLNFVSADVNLVKNGKAVADIVVPENAAPAVRTAAKELKRHIEKISGAKLKIVAKPSANVKNHIYTGESDITRKLGIDTSGIAKSGYRIVARDNYVALAGKDSYHYSKLGKRYKGKNRREYQEVWEKFSGKPCRRPSFHDFRDFNQECGFDVLDATGTLHAAYALLEQLGMRWYLPYEEIGIVYPKLKDISIKTQDVKREPDLAQRIYADGGKGAFTNEFLWFKFMGAGTDKVIPIYHSTGRLMDYPKKQPKEYFGVINGKIDYTSPRLSNKRYRKDFIGYLEDADRFFPNVEYACIGQPDGWSVIDSSDAAAGWDKVKSRGKAGSFSDYAWDFILDVRKQYMKKHPGRKFTVFAYSSTNRVPEKLDKVPDNVLVAFTQTSQNWMLPEFRNQLSRRDEWAKKIKNKDQLLIWEYYTRHSHVYNFPPVPIIFTKFMKQNLDWVHNHANGCMVESGWTAGKEREKTKLITPRIGLSHLMLYLHGKLAWDKNLDVNKLLNEYYRLFFGPAEKEMKEFYEFSEQVWVRPEPRMITSSSGFLTRKDVKKFFDILSRAKQKAGDTVYGKRIDLIASEMEPLKKLHDKLKRSGPKLRAYYAPSKPEIDGDLDKPFWKRKHSFYPLRDMVTGELPEHVKTEASFRWLRDNSALVVGIRCYEPKMNKLNESCKNRDSMAIFSDDNIELQFETDGGIRPKIVINPAGIIYDYCVTGKAEDLPLFYTVKKVAVKKYPDCWTAEILIDAKEIAGKKPIPFYPWGVNVCRQRMAGNTPEFYMLSPSGTNFKDTKCMGNLYLRK